MNNRQRRNLRKRVIAAHGSDCWLCGLPITIGLGRKATGVRMTNPLAFSVDHVLPQALGGTYDMDNLRPAHRQCNNERHWLAGCAVREAASKDVRAA